MIQAGDPLPGPAARVLWLHPPTSFHVWPTFTSTTLRSARRERSCAKASIIVSCKDGAGSFGIGLGNLEQQLVMHARRPDRR